MPTPWLSWPGEVGAHQVVGHLLGLVLGAAHAARRSGWRARGAPVGVRIVGMLGADRLTRPPAAPASTARPGASGLATSGVVSIASTASASRAARSAPSTASVRPANFARSSASVRKLAGSPFGTTTFCAEALAARRDGQLAGHVGGELGLDLRIELAAHLRQQAAHRRVLQQPVAVPAHRAGRQRGGDDERTAELAVHHVLRIGLLLRRLRRSASCPRAAGPSVTALISAGFRSFAARSASAASIPAWP